MATFAIGDLHGCQGALDRLLDRLPLDPERDRLWLVGDLVNRGPSSLAVLRWARRTAAAMGERFVAVLGNHDLHLLSAAAGLRSPRPLDTLEEVLEAADGSELVEWLARRPLLHRQDGWTLVHAGLLPEWTVERAARAARRAEELLHGPRRPDLLSARADSESALAEVRRGLDVLTRVRTLDAAGHLNGFSGPPAAAPDGLVPWFRVPDRASLGESIVCGHWAALGLHREGGVTAIDTGCVWGGSLTAVRLDDGEVFQVA